MKENGWGGQRDGAGRVALDPSQKKKGAKIYIKDEEKNSVLKYGKGRSFSEKVLELALSEIETRKKNKDLRGEEDV